MQRQTQKQIEMRKTNTSLGYRKTEGCCQPYPSCLTMTKTQKNAKTNTKQIEMRKTNTALGYRKTEGCCQPHPSCLTMTKTQKNAKTKRQTQNK